MGVATFAEPSHMLDDSMTVEEAADVLDVSRARIYAMMNDGSIRSTKVGNMRMVSAADVADRFNNPHAAGRPRKASAAADAV